MRLKCISQLCIAFILASTLWPNISFVSAQDKQKIIIGKTGQSAPYAINDSKNKGFDTDLFTVIFGRLGYEIEIFYQPVKRLPTLLMSKKIDVMTTWENNPISCSKSTAYRYWHDGILTINKSDIMINGPQDLKGKIVGAFSGASIVLAQELKKHIKSFDDYFEVPSSENAAKMLYSNRFDAYIGDIWAVSYYFNHHAKDQKKPPTLIVNYAFKPIPEILCFNSEPLRDQFEKELAIYRASGEYEALKIKYIPEVASLK